MLCGVLGLVISTILFFGWKDSTKSWKRAIA